MPAAPASRRRCKDDVRETPGGRQSRPYVTPERPRLSQNLLESLAKPPCVTDRLRNVEKTKNET